ncbi:hypothetical protein [Crocosphaera sp. Alani8]|uniref:hypothetical protein n=1 Tax=Crocosphaera sp. Alani8 TaxID=3038952 RepID=UPI00313C738D
MKKPSKLLISTSITFLVLGQFTPLVMGYPGNQQRYDCYRKSNNQFAFGSPNNVSNNNILCTPNPNYRPRNRSSQQRPSSNTRRSSRRVYQNIYQRSRNNTGEKIAIGLGSFVFGTLVGNSLSPRWGWGGWSDWDGWGDNIYIDDSVNYIDFGDINVDIGDVNELDSSIQDIDLIEIDASVDQFSEDDFGDDNFNDGDFGGDDFGGDDFGGDDFGGDDFGGDDFGGDDW